MEIINYSITTDASSMDMSDMYTGVGQINAQVEETPDTRYMLSREMTLTDFVGVEHIALVRQVNARNGEVSLTAEDTIRRFNVDRWTHTFPQFPLDESAITGIIKYLCNEVGVGYDVRYTPSTRTENDVITFSGGKINLWDTLKELAAIHRIDIWVEGQTVVFDNLGGNKLEIIDATSEGWAANISDIANWVEIIWYEPTVRNYWERDLEFHPRGNNEDAPIIQVDAGEVVETEIEVNAWVTNVNQPQCVEWVDNETYDDTNGVYSVIGNDNLPVTPQQWLNNGGSLEVELTDDSSIVKVTVRGANVEELAPFRIAMSSGNHYNSLHLTGWSMPWRERVTRVYTGAGSELTSQETGAQIDTRHVQDLSHAYDVAYRVARSYAGPNLEIELDSVSGVNVGTIITTPDANFRVEQKVTGPLSAQLRTGEASTIEDFNEVWGVGEGASYTFEWVGTPDNSASEAKRNNETYATNLWKNPKPSSGSWEIDSSNNSVVTYPDSTASPSGKVCRIDIVEDFGSIIIQDRKLFVPQEGVPYTFSWWFAYKIPIRHYTGLYLWPVDSAGDPVGGGRILMRSGDEYKFPFGAPSGETYSFTTTFSNTPTNVVGYILDFTTMYEFKGQQFSLGAITATEGEAPIAWFDGDTTDHDGSGGPTFQDFNYQFEDRLYQDFATSPLRRNNG